jgi:hypothetical protein
MIDFCQKQVASTAGTYTDLISMSRKTSPLQSYDSLSKLAVEENAGRMGAECHSASP